MIPRARSRWLAFALLAGACFGATLALAQPRPRRPAAPPKGTRADAEAPEAGKEAVAPRPETAAGGKEARDAGAGAVEAKAVDGGGHVFRFGEVEIEGRLRNPQIVYFLRRVRAEFAADDLGHRSFMRELDETRKDPNF